VKLLVLILTLVGTFLFSIYFLPKEKKPILQTERTTHTDTLEFKTQIQPILISHCSPCHFPGGKMFERLPFDKAETVLMLNERLLKRIKDSKENALIKEFISQSNSKE
jgi:hypothetical protein